MTGAGARFARRTIMRATAVRLLPSLLLAILTACSSHSGTVVGDDDDDGGDDDGGDDDAPGVDANPGDVDAMSMPDANSAPQELRVCASGAPYTTIGAAITAAHAGDTITICAGTFRERLVIDKALHLQGAGAATVIDAEAGGTAVLVRDVLGTGMIVESLTIRNGKT